MFFFCIFCGTFRLLRDAILFESHVLSSKRLVNTLPDKTSACRLGLESKLQNKTGFFITHRRRLELGIGDLFCVPVRKDFEKNAYPPIIDCVFTQIRSLSVALKLPLL